MGVSNHLPRSELKRKSKVSNAGGHVTLEKVMSMLAKRMMRWPGYLEVISL